MTRGDLDPKIVRRHLVALDEALQRLKRHRTKSRAELEAMPDAMWAIERGLQLCAQNTLDIATHLVTHAGRDVADYATSIDALGDMGVLPAKSCARGVVVHVHVSRGRARLRARAWISRRRRARARLTGAELG